VESCEVAIKTTAPQANKTYLRALLSEIKILIYLGHHENIVELIGVDTSELSSGQVVMWYAYKILNSYSILSGL